jgi:hypothetical protein
MNKPHGNGPLLSHVGYAFYKEQEPVPYKKGEGPLDAWRQGLHRINSRLTEELMNSYRLKPLMLTLRQVFAFV